MTAAAARCRVCSAELPPDAARCPQCSAAAGPLERPHGGAEGGPTPRGPLDPCPHCRAQAGASPDGELRYVCDVCGGPRVPRLDRTIAYSGREIAPLRRADAARRGRAGWRAAAIASGLLLPFVALVFVALLAILGASFGLVLTALVLTAPVGAFLATAVSRAGARGREIGPAIDAAWLAVAGDVARQSKGRLTATGLALELGIEEAQAEELIALLDVNELVSPEARVEEAEPPRVRIGEDTAAPPGQTQVASAEDEAALAEEAGAEARARAPAAKP